MAARWGRYVRWALWAAIFAAVGYVAWSNRDALREAGRHMATASVPWMLGALAAIGCVYLFRGLVYGIPLRLMRYTVPWLFLWQAAIIASAVNQLLPSGGASSYAFLTWALYQRGVRSGQASLMALMDTLSYALAMATLVIGTLIYVGLTGTLEGKALLLGFAPGVVVVALAGWVYYLQRDEKRFTNLVLRIERRVSHFFGGRSHAAGTREFLEDYYEGKKILSRRPGALTRMLALQYLVVAADAGALYCTFRALSLEVSLWVVFLGFVVAMAAGMVVNAPAGGGSFEVVMSAFFVQQGVDKADAIAAAILFRVVAFWVPLVVSGVLLIGFRRRTKEIRRSPAASGVAMVLLAATLAVPLAACETAPVPVVEAVPDLRGTWTGTWGGTPLTLHILEQEETGGSGVYLGSWLMLGDRRPGVTGTLTFAMGGAPTSANVTGWLGRSNGVLTLLLTSTTSHGPQQLVLKLADGQPPSASASRAQVQRLTGEGISRFLSGPEGAIELQRR